MEPEKSCCKQPYASQRTLWKDSVQTFACLCSKDNFPSFALFLAHMFCLLFEQTQIWSPQQFCVQCFSSTVFHVLTWPLLGMFFSSVANSTCLMVVIKKSVSEFGVNHVGCVQPDSCRTHHQLKTGPGWTALAWLQARPSANTITSRNTGWVWLYDIMKLMRSVLPESTESTERSCRIDFDYICWFLHQNSFNCC